jgi:hypothetical protein
MSTTNPFDRKLAGVLKSLSKGIKDAPVSDKIGKDFHAIRSRVVDSDLGRIFDDLFRNLSAPAEQRLKPDQTQAIAMIRALCDRQYVSSAAFLFAGWRDLVSPLPLEDVLSLAPDSPSFESWQKASGQPVKEVAEKLLIEPATIYPTAGADWLLFRIPPEKQILLLDLFLTRQPRPKFLPNWSEALALALQKDKRGELLRTLLRHPWPDENRILALAEVYRGNPALMKGVIDALPALLTSKEPPAGTMRLVRNLFVNLVSTRDTERQFASASLARLGTGILLHHAIGPVAMETLEFIQQTTHQLRGTTRDTETQSRTWVLDCLQGPPPPPDGRLQITLDGALQFAIAFEKAAQDFPAAAILSMTAQNLGLTNIGELGQTVSYDPLQHEDVDRGMIPGDPAVIESQGWLHGENVILRSKVRKQKG